MCTTAKDEETDRWDRVLVFIAVSVVTLLLEAGEVRTAVLNEAVRRYAAGEYPQAIAEIDDVERLLEGTPMKAEAVLLRAQIISFTKILEKVQEAVRINDPDAILRTVADADVLDRVIAPRGSGWRDQGRKIRAWGYYLKAARAERRDHYAEADEWYQKCATEDPERVECVGWLAAKPKLLQKLFLKAQLYQSYDPLQAMRLYQDICKMTERTDEMNQKARRELALTERPK